MTKWVYAFGDGKAEGEAGMKNLLGGKGANLAEMSNLGLPVPPGFTITTEVCTYYYANKRNLSRRPEGTGRPRRCARSAIRPRAISAIPTSRCCVSVRSGARVSMPGMMDTVLNLGLNAATAEGLAKLTGDARFAYDSYRRFIQMYSDVVLGVDHAHVRGNPGRREGRQGRRTGHRSGRRRPQAHRRRSTRSGSKRNWASLSRKMCRNSLWGAIGAVFGSWHSPRANTYRKLNNIPEDWGTAVTVQAMVFGNRGETSATGVAFTRDPATGEKLLYGEFLINAQGEDVVAGIRTPQPISKVVRERQGGQAAVAWKKPCPRPMPN